LKEKKLVKKSVSHYAFVLLHSEACRQTNDLNYAVLTFTLIVKHKCMLTFWLNAYT